MKIETVTKYIADDGTEFDSEYMCIRHESVVNLCTEIEAYYGATSSVSLDEAIEYVVDNFTLGRVELKGLVQRGTV